MNHELEFKKQEETETIIGGLDISLFRYDVRVFLITLKRRLPFLIIVPLLTTALAFCYVMYYKSPSWIARCMLFRNTQMERSEDEDIPKIYKPLLQVRFCLF
ncbi:MAG: hypothetical protein GY750_19595 [Lentisphaerae bacterium]|nr:hypothetical protein [Lentisphaerota bacterium]MCP4103602.1 hypothetical protein [Lentisphaerota bacterium]